MPSNSSAPDIKTLDLPDGLIPKLTEAANLIKTTNTPIRVISHYDADGLTAGAIMCAILIRQKKRFHISLEHNLDPNSEVFSELTDAGPQLKIFLDMGTGQFKSIADLPGWNIILDHHRLNNENDAKNIIHINVHLFGLNGTFEISGATLAFLLAISVSNQNWDLIKIALAGAIGDKQNKNGFKGLNKKLMQTGLDLGLIQEDVELKLRGSNVLEALVTSTDPYFVGISNNEDGVKTLLASLDIDPNTELNNLEKPAVQRLASYLTIKLLEQDVPPEDAEDMITKKYRSSDVDVDLEEYSHQINSCGRMNQIGVGVAMCLGDAKALEIAIELRKKYKKKIRDGLKRLEKEGLSELQNIQYFNESVPEFAGTFAGIGMMYFFNQSKPVLTLTKTDKDIRISGRGTKRLVDSGLDMAIVLSKVASELGGTGGGHNVAAGATIPLENEDKFLEMVDKLVGEQLNQEQEKK
jgi:RecJ-like exonuclease